MLSNVNDINIIESKNMFRTVIEEVKNQNKKGVILTCKDKLIHYYEKFGFVNEGLSESNHGGESWYQMKLKIV